MACPKVIKCGLLYVDQWLGRKRLERVMVKRCLAAPGLGSAEIRRQTSLVQRYQACESERDDRATEDRSLHRHPDPSLAGDARGSATHRTVFVGNIFHLVRDTFAHLFLRTTIIEIIIIYMYACIARGSALPDHKVFEC